ncbi:SDR family oxidoreductase [Parvularcula marina]|uniref:SDR family NAD(P)-dependent oxidoreductase n=1 Tax=Parvularcula marina TaxID=2292771 RepID=A0A371RIJ8_9PROT|nr:SDR family oxidoreductase [Parvularcula marina]RFB05287.1 SDR family NAD(P)-dependent oxidoreductase [Parvularcula marina]
MSSVLITGANRGIGLEFARQYAASGWTVHAACRQPHSAGELNALGGIRLHEIDVTDHNSIDALAAKIDEPIDVVIANAGVMGPRSDQQSFGSFDYEAWRAVMEVNLYGTVHTCEAFTPHLEKGDQKKLAVLSSKMGSIADTSGGLAHYRTSKTALNMAIMASAAGLAQKGIAAGIFHPGWVQTDMGGPSALITTEECVTGLRQQIAGLPVTAKPDFLTFDGEVLSW